MIKQTAIAARKLAVAIAAPMAALTTMAACSPAETDPGPGGVTVGEARSLDEAAAMLDSQRLPEGATAEGPMAEGPMAEGAATNAAAEERQPN